MKAQGNALGKCTAANAGALKGRDFGPLQRPYPALSEAAGLNHNYVGSEHLFLGLLAEDEGVAAQVLMNLGAKLTTVRAEVRALLGHSLAERTSVIPRQSATIEAPPAACPKCGNSQLVRILWNSTDLMSDKDLEDVAAQRAIIATKIGENVRSWVCLTCEPRWSEVHRLGQQDYQWQRAKEAAVASQAWEEAARLRDSQYELRRRLMAVVEELLRGA